MLLYDSSLHCGGCNLAQASATTPILQLDAMIKESAMFTLFFTILGIIYFLYLPQECLMLPYILLPTWLQQRLHGRPYDLSVFSAIAAHRNIDNNTSYKLTIKYISEFSGVSRRQVYNSVKFLCDSCLMSVEKKENGSYTFNLECLNPLQVDTSNQVDTPNTEIRDEPIAKVINFN